MTDRTKKMSPLELWAGAECSIVRVRDVYVDQLVLTGHAARTDDLQRLAALGARAVRQPVLWERTMTPARDPDWSFADERLQSLKDLGLRPIVGLVHHGSGPPGTSLVEPSFVDGLAAFARSVAERFPWVTDYTPVNEPLTTARFSCLYGHWYPHARQVEPFLRALLVQCLATRAAMRAIREVVPGARLVQTEDLGTVFATRRLAYQARFENHRRLLSLDLLTGRVGPRHPLRGFLLGCGITEQELDDLVSDPCPPDIIGLNHYVTSDRFLDERVMRYPPQVRGGNWRETYADVEAVRVRGAGISGHHALLELLWRRYRTPLAITEVHLGCFPEEQIRWFHEAWRGAQAARAEGADVRAVTLWSAFGACDWDSLLTSANGTYEPGVFDVRGGVVRPTALVQVASELASRGASDHPLLSTPGWWRRRDRLVYPAHGHPPDTSVPSIRARPLLVTGASGTLGRAVERVCRDRGLRVVALDRAALDIANASAVREALDHYRPWGVVNAAGYVRVDDAESDRAACFRANADGAAVLAEACASRDLRLATISSDLVFDGCKTTPYVERDGVSALNVYGESKAAAERLVAELHPAAIIARTSAFFGPWDEASFVHGALLALESGAQLRAAADVTVSPTYVPDLAHAIVTLLVDGASGVWHLSTPGAMTWFELAREAARHADIQADTLVPCEGAALGLPARRPAYTVLASERGALLRPLAEVLSLFAESWRGRTLAATA